MSETTYETHAQGLPRKAGYVVGSLRIALGGIFLWAFLDKLFGLGFATARENAWINGGSPTYGFLTHGTAGPFAGFYQSIAGNPFVDALFMMGLLGVGLAMVLGVGVTLAAYSGAMMLLLMWSAALPPANNPVLDDHIIYAVALVVLAWLDAGRYLGLGTWWAEQPFVRRYARALA